MFDTDELECTYLHLHSMRHFQTMLTQFANADPQAAAPADDDDAPEKAELESEDT